MKIRLLKYIAIASVIITFSSCSDWLGEVDPNVSNKDNYWNNLNQTNSTLSAAYAALVSDFALNLKEEAPRSDMATPGFGRPTYSGDAAVWYTQTYTNSNKSIILKWEVLYNGIFRANQVIEALNNLENISSQEEWDLQMAQARFLRGLYHFYLHSAYNKGNIIIKDYVPSNLEEYNQPLSKSEDVIKFFRNDLNYAFDHLPLAYDKTEQGRATKGAAATILGTSFLYEATEANSGIPEEALLDSAIAKFEFVKGSGQYELVRDMSLMFTTAGAMNKESIFEIAFSNGFNSEYGNWVEDGLFNHLAFYFDGKGSNNSNIYPSLWAINAYKSEKIDPLDPRNKVTAEVWTPIPNSPNYDISEVEIDRKVSMRASAMMAMVQDDYTPYYGGVFHSEFSFPGEAKKTQNGFGRYKHYNNHDALTDESENPGGKQRSGKNVTVNRLSDLYLMLAECYIYKGNTTEAIALVNAVRERWALELIGLSNGDVNHTYDEISYSKDALLARLQDVEKPLETSIEGHCIRWFDLRRWGKLESNFEKHAAEVFYTENYIVTYGQINGDASKSWSTVSDVLDPSNTNAVIVTDYADAAANFDYDRHAWLPIPSTEEAANSAL